MAWSPRHVPAATFVPIAWSLCVRRHQIKRRLSLLALPDQDLPHRQLLPRRRPYSLRRPHWLRTLDAAVEIHQRGECVFVIRRLLDALEATDCLSSADLAIGVTGDRIEGGGKDSVAKGEG